MWARRLDAPGASVTSREGRGQGTHNARGDASGLTLVGNDHRYAFPGAHTPAELARLFLQALDELNAQAP